jgi:hypothetical protein
VFLSSYSRADVDQVMFVNTHIHWDPACEDVKVMQVQMLTERLEQIEKAHRYRGSVSLCFKNECVNFISFHFIFFFPMYFIIELVISFLVCLDFEFCLTCQESMRTPYADCGVWRLQFYHRFSCVHIAWNKVCDGGDARGERDVRNMIGFRFICLISLFFFTFSSSFVFFLARAFSVSAFDRSSHVAGLWRVNIRIWRSTTMVTTADTVSSTPWSSSPPTKPYETQWSVHVDSFYLFCVLWIVVLLFWTPDWSSSCLCYYYLFESFRALWIYSLFPPSHA